MAMHVDTVQTLRDYFDGVMGKADDHAKTVNEVCLTIVGAIIWKADANSIQFHAVGGKAKNVLWATFSGRRLCFVFSHPNQSIEIKENSWQGPVIRSFTNLDSAADVKQWFNAL